MDLRKVGWFGDVFVNEVKGGIQHNTNMQNSDEQEWAYKSLKKRSKPITPRYAIADHDVWVSGGWCEGWRTVSSQEGYLPLSRLIWLVDDGHGSGADVGRCSDGFSFVGLEKTWCAGVDWPDVSARGYWPARHRGGFYGYRRQDESGAIRWHNQQPAPPRAQSWL